MPDDPETRPAEHTGGAPTPAAAPAAKEEESPKEDWETRFKYLLADFDNYRKRSDREREAHRAFVRAELLRRLLPILEAFDRARAAVAKAPKGDPIRAGVDLLSREWETFLKTEGVEPVARVGARFRPDDQEAVAEAPLSREFPEGTVVEVVQQGYRFAGGLLRPAKVVVARRPVPPPTPAAEVAAADLDPPHATEPSE